MMWREREREREKERESLLSLQPNQDERISSQWESRSGAVCGDNMGSTLKQTNKQTNKTRRNKLNQIKSKSAHKKTNSKSGWSSSHPDPAPIRGFCHEMRTKRRVTMRKGRTRVEARGGRAGWGALLTEASPEHTAPSPTNVRWGNDRVTFQN